MARKGNNKSGTKKNQPYQGKNNKQSKKPEPIKYFIPPARNVIDKAFQNAFWPEGHEWKGLQVEYPAKPNGVYAEINYYMDEIDDPILYEQTIRKILKDLKINEEIEWYELIKKSVPWDEEKDYLRLRAK